MKDTENTLNNLEILEEKVNQLLEYKTTADEMTETIKILKLQIQNLNLDNNRIEVINNKINSISSTLENLNYKMSLLKDFTRKVSIPQDSDEIRFEQR